MEEKQMRVEDESGDKKYFTIVPNYILNHSTASAQALYLQLKRLAGENGVACCGSRYLQKQLGMTHNTIKKEFEYLLRKGWIKYNGEQSVMTDGGVQKVKTYKIIDLWQINIKEYQNNNTLTTKGYQNNNAGVSNKQHPPKGRGIKITTKEELRTKEPIAEPSSAEWNLEDKLNSMEKEPNSYLDVIATFIREKPVKIENSAQLSNVISRYCRVAKKLAGAYTNQQIFGAVELIKKDNLKRKFKGDEVDYTLETVYKYLTK